MFYNLLALLFNVTLPANKPTATTQVYTVYLCYPISVEVRHLTANEKTALFNVTLSADKPTANSQVHITVSANGRGGKTFDSQ